jgi:hypothetical protein
MGKPSKITDLQLDSDRIIETVHALGHRIEERFPSSGLGTLAERLDSIANNVVERLERAAKPILALRVAVGVCIIGLAAILVEFFLMDFSDVRPSVAEFVEAVGAGTEGLIFLGLTLIFLFTLEGRIKRRRALHSLRELRALAHIIDMHQLTKDPDRVIGGVVDTPSSPDRELGKFQIGRYLDYCSEMLSLVSKVAALYAQSFDDPVVLAAVDEVEGLTTGLSAKMWQKIMIIDREPPDG